MDCSCAPMFRFFCVASDGATTERQIQNRVFGQFRTSLRKDRVANYASIFSLFSLCVRGPHALCKTLNISNLVAPPNNRYAKCLVLYKCICSSNTQRKQRPNLSIIGDAILPQTCTKLTGKRGSKFVALLWRHLTPHRKTTIQVHNYNPSCIQLLEKILENLLPV